MAIPRPLPQEYERTARRSLPDGVSRVANSYQRLFSLTSPGNHALSSVPLLLRSAATLIALGPAAALSKSQVRAVGAALHEANAEHLKSGLCKLIDGQLAQVGGGRGEKGTLDGIGQLTNCPPSPNPPTARMAWPRGPQGGGGAGDGGFRDGGEDRGSDGRRRQSDDESEMIKLGELHFDTRIGAGAAGATYAGTWKGVRVAIKVAGGASVGDQRVAQ